MVARKSSCEAWNSLAHIFASYKHKLFMMWCEVGNLVAHLCLKPSITSYMTSIDQKMSFSKWEKSAMTVWGLLWLLLGFAWYFACLKAIIHPHSHSSSLLIVSCKVLVQEKIHVYSPADYWAKNFCFFFFLFIFIVHFI